MKKLKISLQVHYSISELVEEKSTDEEEDEGWDIADYIWKGRRIVGEVVSIRTINPMT